ncbi:MAG TPA: alpha/beta fold hydrolase [Anaerolineales bacterium]|nr:alpha/beta fold hydrolase [Anaerolineales bacterium]
MKISFSPAMRLCLVLIIFFSSVAAIPFSPLVHKTNTEKLLEELGGLPCSEDSSFTCVTIEVPLDHFNPADTRTIPVVFAVLPASGARKGMFVTATGGPGTSGVLLADSYTAGFDPSIPEAFDIVFFDQRGMGLSGGLTCPSAANVYYQQDTRGLTRKQEQALKKTAHTFAAHCVRELSNPDLLPYLGTKQAVEDLEVFRQMSGDEKFWLYGESYGTQYAQLYAASHRDHLAGLVLDATVDLTFNGIEYYSQQAQAFNDTLVATLSACNDDPACLADLNGDAIPAYDELATKLSKHPLPFRFPLPEGRFANRKFTLANLEFVAASQMYAESDRMIFTRALAAYASNSDIVTLARLLYIDLGVDPQTLKVIPDPSYSDAIFYGVECQDYGYPGATPDKKAENYLDAADPIEGSIPRFGSIVYGDLPCAYWPNASSDLTRPDYLLAEGVPTLVLGATADPATPISHGINVYQHLADAYLITTEGGPHVTFGYGNECPDALVTDFLVNDVVPAQRETICDGFVADEYVPIAPRSARAFNDPTEALSSVETEIDYLPEFFYWDGFTPTSVGCTYGGTFNFDTNTAGTKYNFKLNRCELVSNFKLTGTGFYNTELDRFVLDVKTTGRWNCDLRYVRRGENINVTGKCNGKSINTERADKDKAQHEAPSLKQPKEDH